ncbi:MAG: hypothetical protein AVDCRST_MAG68-2911, partial [uncultured Gemmatimonadetes bacterium]
GSRCSLSRFRRPSGLQRRDAPPAASGRRAGTGQRVRPGGGAGGGGRRVPGRPRRERLARRRGRLLGYRVRGARLLDGRGELHPRPRRPRARLRDPAGRRSAELGL